VDLMSLTATHRVLAQVVHALGNAGVSDAATVTFVDDLIAVSPRPDATADDGWTMQAAIVELLPSYSIGDSGSVAFGSIDGTHVLVSATAPVWVLS
jgi:hypothetical protein